MKRIILTVVITMVVLFTMTVAPSFAMVKGIDSSNFDSYVKSNADEYGFNKGECDMPYLVGEEYFYNDYYDHWNVDKVYDSSKVTNRKLAVAFAKANYPKCKVVVIKSTNKNFWKKIDNRKGKKIVYIERTVTKSSGKDYGYTIKGHYYVAYNKKVKKGKRVVSYFVWNPNTNYCDDVVASVDNKMIRSDFSY